MIFLSTLLRQSVYDSENRRVGAVRDVCVALNETFPTVTALVVHSSEGNGTMYIPWSQVASIEEFPVRLTVRQDQITPYIPDEDELLLRRDILDKQIVDTQGFRVVKVNDLKLAQIKKTARLVGVDISLSGLLRRLGVQPALDALSRVMPIQLGERTITWNYVEPIRMVRAGTGQLALAGATAGASAVVPQVQLNVSHNKLADLHPADIADILEQLNVEEAGAMLDRLDTETAADALNEVEYPLQSEILSELDPERASDLLERLPPDDAADILADIPRAEAERLLNLMPVDEARPIRDLLRYGEQTAGGIMTNEVLALSQNMTVEEALAYLRQHSEHMEMIYYLYIVDEERRLSGVVSLRQLVTAEPGTHMRDLMDTDVITVQTGTDQEEVARIIAKYDLLGVPVVDDEKHLVGLVTVDDVIDVIHEEQAEDFSEIAGADVEESEEEEHFTWRTAARRFSWLAVNVFAGFILALVLNQIFHPLLYNGAALARATGLNSRVAIAGMFCFVPMLLLTSGSAGSQASGIAGWRLRTKRGRDFWRGFLHELQHGTIGGILTSILVAALAWLLFRSLPLSIAIGLGLGLTLLIAAICGIIFPNLFERLRLRGSLMTAPLLDPVIAVISLSVFLTVTMLLVEQLHA
ncbi:MAG TPA: magnesium transporter [Ktedonobacteraceae bacterium]|nr:magnesium transporter [Ktedonobacteraceae bacterium]